jgi:hypothetical protein
MEFQLLDDEPRQGSHLHGVSKVAGRRIEWEMEYAESNLGRRTLLRTTNAPLDSTIEETFEASGGGTKSTYHQTTEPFRGLFGKLADSLVIRLYQRDVRSNLENSKFCSRRNKSANCRIGETYDGRFARLFL